MGANASSSANSKDTTTSPPPPRRKAASTKPAPEAPDRKLRASTVAKSAATVEGLVRLPTPPPRRRAPKRALTDETVESAADAAAEPTSLLQQPKLPVVTHRPRKKTGWAPGAGKGKEEKAAYRFLKASDHEFRRLYALYVARVEGDLTLDEETKLLVQGLFSGFKELHGALAEVDEVHPTDVRLSNITKCALQLSNAARAVASNKITGSYFVEVISVLSGASRRGYSPEDALAEFDKHLDVVTKKRENRDAYLDITAEGGRDGRVHGKNVKFDGETTVAQRKYFAELRRATATGEREPRCEGATMETHALAAKAVADDKKRQNKNLKRRAKGAQKAQAVATPKDCTLALYLGNGGVPLFVTQPHLVPQGADNTPLIAEKAAARAVQHRAEKGRKTLAEIEEDRRTRLPDKVQASEAKSRAGQYYVVFCMNKSWPYSAAIRRKFKNNFSVVKPGTDGYYASTKAAAEVRDEWIELERPENWIAKEKK